RDRHPLVASEMMLEEPKVPGLGIAAVSDSSTEEEVLHVEVEAVRLVLAGPPGNLLGQFGNDDLVGIDDQDPLVAERQIIKGPILLLGIGPIEVKLDDRGAMFGRDFGRLVRALTVHDEDFIGPGQGRQAAPEVLGLVLDGDQDADFDASSRRRVGHESLRSRMDESKNPPTIRSDFGSNPGSHQTTSPHHRMVRVGPTSVETMVTSIKHLLPRLESGLLIKKEEGRQFVIASRIVFQSPRASSTASGAG